MGVLSKIASLGIGDIADGIGSLAKDIRTAITGKEPLTAESVAKIETQLNQLQAKAIAANTRLVEVQGAVVMAEAQGESWLQRNWRPMLMMSMVIIVFNNYIIFPYVELFFPGNAVILKLPADLWGLMKIGVGGYVMGRSAEKVVKGSKWSKESNEK